MGPSSRLTPKQLHALASELPRTVVQGAAGSGKTTLLAARIAHLLDLGLNPDLILALASSRSACDRIRRLVEEFAGPTRAGLVKILTFRGYAWDLMGVSRRHSVATEAESEGAIRSLLEGGKRREHVLPFEEMSREISRYEAEFYGPHPSVGLVLTRMFDSDGVPAWYLLPSLESDSSSGLHVLADDAQNLTARELRLVTGLSAGGSLFLTNDPRQAVLSSRGGKGITFPATHRLTRSLRFGSAIADRVNQVAVCMAEDAISGVGQVGQVVEGRISDIVLAEGSRAVLCKSDRECRLVAMDLGEEAVVAARNPSEALDTEEDRFAEIALAGKIAVCTIRAARGWEWDAVAVVPPAHDSMSPEDLRFEYVSFTRARRLLILVGSRGDGSQSDREA